MKRIYLLLIMTVLCSSVALAQGQKRTSLPEKTNAVIATTVTPELKHATITPLAQDVISEQVKATELTPVGDFAFSSPINRAPLAATSVYYPRPLGTYFGGFTNYDGKCYPALYGPSNLAMQFYALDFLSNTTTYSWFINNNEITGDIDGAGNLSFIMGRPSALGKGYSMIELRGKNGSDASSYKYAEHMPNQFLILSEPAVNAMTNADITFEFPNGGSNIFVAWSATEYFGTGYSVDGVPCDGVVELYQAPISPIYVPSIDAFVIPVDDSKPLIPEGKSVTCSVYYLTEEGKINYSEPIGTSSITADDLKTGKFSDVLHFTFFEEDDLGIITEAPLTLSDNFVIVISGIDECNMKFVLSSHQDLWGGSAYTLHKGQLSSFSWDDGSNAVDLNIQINAIYNCLVVDEETKNLTAPVEGGYLEWYSEEEKETYNNIFINSSYGADDVWIESAPSWIGEFEIDDENYSDYNVLFAYAKAEALPTGVDGRTGYITFGSYGITAKVKVTQGTGGVGIGEIASSEELKVVRNPESFELTYPTAATSVSLYNISGQKVAEYQLTESGSFSLPAANLINGAYILRFNGINQSVKILK
ncbi:T9SS type A sorting domain-containing protein [Bacteroidales bacterium OttesenSCG-928-M11]|nr:T9SS type A sorting domain-containing protein [Bacteroidales bacterium OttesenSCG-928-M11]